VRFVIARDAAERFSFLPIQGDDGGRLASRLGIDRDAPETNAVVLGGIAYFKSDAAIQVLQRLPGWRWTACLDVVPRGLRDWFYDRIARNRYRLFGRSDVCLIPTRRPR